MRRGDGTVAMSRDLFSGCAQLGDTAALILERYLEQISWAEPPSPQRGERAGGRGQLSAASEPPDAGMPEPSDSDLANGGNARTSLSPEGAVERRKQPPRRRRSRIRRAHLAHRSDPRAERRGADLRAAAGARCRDTGAHTGDQPARVGAARADRVSPRAERSVADAALSSRARSAGAARRGQVDHRCGAPCSGIDGGIGSSPLPRGLRCAR